MNLKVVIVFVAGFAAGALVVYCALRGRYPNAALAAPSSVPMRASQESKPSAASTARPTVPLAASTGATVTPAPAGGSVPAPAVQADTAPVYTFAEVSSALPGLEAIFRTERTDPAWSPQTVDAFNLLVAGLPERSLIGDYAFACKESLCRFEITGDARQVAPNDPKNNLQLALNRAMAGPAAQELFDDSMMHVNMGENDLVTVTIYAHRRKPKN